jgi:SOS-response transcriptional repressor LexA
MNLYFMRAIENLEYENDGITGLQIKACALRNMTGAKLLRQELKQHIEISSKTHLKNELPFYYLLTAYCCTFTDEFKEAKKISEMAIENFKICGMSWNEAIGHWFLGLIYRTEKRGYLYLAELDKALKIVSPASANYLAQGDYVSAMRCDQVKKELEEQKTIAAKIGTGPLSPPEGKKHEESRNSDYLVLPWIPVYQSVRGGTKGVVWVDPPTEKMATVSEIEIENIPHVLYTIKKTARIDHQIMLRSGMKYGWAKVEGHSMSGAYPISICDGDYVLFYENHQPQDNDIVIASHLNSSGDFAYMVKRYKLSENQLASEPASTDTGFYFSIKISRDHQFLGVAIAVAKH